MPSITGIELGPDSCVLVRARRRPDCVEISSLHQIERSAWPSRVHALAATLRGLRRAHGFPRRARVVAWGLPHPAPDGDPVVRSAIEPLIAAGFRVEAVLTPPEALAEIARIRPRSHGVAAVWLALNAHGAAIAIVRDGQLLFGRTFGWNYTAATGPRAELLKRYTLVAHLAPEVRRGIALARSSHGAIVEVAVTCGDLPELRSLTMPLIEELDLEVETLDSTDGLSAIGKARSDRFAETAPALWLAAAAATVPRSPRSRRLALAPLMRAAAAVIVVAAVGLVGYRSWTGPPAHPVGERVATIGRDAPASAAGTSSAVRPPVDKTISVTSTPATTSASPPVSAPSPPVTAAPPPGATTPAPRAARDEPPRDRARQIAAPPPQAAPAKPSAGNELPSATRAPIPVNPVPPQSKKPAAPATSPPPSRPDGAPAQRVTDVPATQAPTPPQSKPSPPGSSEATQAEQTAFEPRAPAPKPVPMNARMPDPEPLGPSRERAGTARRQPAPLRVALPQVESILVAEDRRVAVVGGRIVGIGDQVGPRVVAQIERDAVVLREPSGYQIRVPVRRGSMD